MSIHHANELTNEMDDFDESSSAQESTSSKRLERRRRIEDLFEEKRLQEELADFG